MNQEGLRRTAIPATVTWLIGWYSIKRAEIDLWFSWAAATPSSTCADVLQGRRLSECLRLGIGGDFPGKFGHYWGYVGETSSVWWWLAVPVLIWVTRYLLPWVLEGFHSDQ